MNHPAPWLWLADIAPARQSEWIASQSDWLSEPERSRLERMGRAERRAQFLAGHILLRRLVAARAQIEVRRIALGSQSDGRPELIAPAGWQPSLAHSRHWVAALLDAGECGVGVDIEFMRADRQIEAIVEMACSTKAGSPEQGYLLWAQREAEIKAGSEHRVWVTTWADHALAVCASARPAVAVVDLAGDAPARPVELEWISRPALASMRTADGC